MDEHHQHHQEAVMKTDRELEDDVLAELDWDPKISDPTEIAVAAYRGHVTLRGTVGSLHQRRAAVAAAKRVDGTYDVEDQLQVRILDDLARDDAEIRGAALQALEWNAQVGASAIDVAVDVGHVTLTGHVDWPYQKQAAEETVATMIGVLGVRNEIEVTGSMMEVGTLADRIGEAMRRSAQADADRISITIGDGSVTLEGSVTSWAEHDAAIAAASAAPGVRTVHDHLLVSDI
jgi:osmotically-inducible protein OsmY